MGFLKVCRLLLMVCGYPIGSSSLLHLNLAVFIGWFHLWVLFLLLVLVCVSGKGCFVCNYGEGGFRENFP